MKGKKVYVGMSGGVDSSVSAGLLKERGFDVVGVFIRVWQPEWLEAEGGCTWREDRLDAMRVAAALDIPFVTLDLSETYKREVVDSMVAEYRAGRTPNPDVMCNRHVKFGGFFDWAMAQGADYVATGHYARGEKKPEVRGSKLEGGEYELLMGRDQGKDQSYFLWTLTERELARTMFPVGGMEKAETRRLARKFGLPVADKRDSQGLCFIGKIDIKEFLSHYVASNRGDVVDEFGQVIGGHDGAVFVTEGERLNFTPTAKGDHEKPYYVVSKDLTANTITVSHRSPTGHLSAEKKEFTLRDVNWISGTPEEGKSYTSRVRHLGELMACHVKGSKVIFKEPLVIASGQSVVVYDDEVCMGGGIVL